MVRISARTAKGVSHGSSSVLLSVFVKKGAIKRAYAAVGVPFLENPGPMMHSRPQKGARSSGTGGLALYALRIGINRLTIKVVQNGRMGPGNLMRRGRIHLLGMI